jgi:hydrogenase-4 component H
MSLVKILEIALRTGRVTRRYPAEEPLLTPEFRGSIEVDPTKCWGCGACTRVCPPNALTLEPSGKGLVLEYFVGRCIFCGMCAEVCPAKAITVTKKFELASANLRDLRSRVVHEVARCSVCGAPIAAEAELGAVVKATPVAEEYATLCPRCRKGRFARSVALRMGVGGGPS